MTRAREACHPERKRGISQSKFGSRKLLCVINYPVRDPSAPPQDDERLGLVIS